MIIIIFSIYFISNIIRLHTKELIEKSTSGQDWLIDYLLSLAQSSCTRPDVMLTTILTAFHQGIRSWRYLLVAVHLKGSPGIPDESLLKAVNVKIWMWE